MENNVKIEKNSMYGSKSMNKYCEMRPKDAFKIVADWSANENHKRKYPKEEVKMLSEALMLLDKFFDDKL